MDIVATVETGTMKYAIWLLFANCLHLCFSDKDKEQMMG